MPSGDAYVAAIFSSIYCYIFGLPWVPFVFVPLVALGRVYVHCHWLGDVLVGSVMGVVHGYLVYGVYFKQLSEPFLLAIIRK